MADKDVTVASGSSDLMILSPEGGTALAAVQQAMGPGESLSFDLLERAKIPAGGGKAWNLDDGAETELEGILVLRQPVRAYWKVSFDESGGGAPPDCASLDNQYGVGDPGGDCTTCPLAEFGSAVDEKGESKAGQACKQLTRMFLLRTDSVLPMFISLPPSSYKEAQKYTVMLAAKAVPYHRVITKIGLQAAKSSGGINYAKAQFSRGRNLTPDEVAAVESWRGSFIPMLEAMSIEQAEAASARE
jgi:hypothetical protein